MTPECLGRIVGSLNRASTAAEPVLKASQIMSLLLTLDEVPRTNARADRDRASSKCHQLNRVPPEALEGASQAELTDRGPIISARTKPIAYDECIVVGDRPKTRRSEAECNEERDRYK